MTIAASLKTTINDPTSKGSYVSGTYTPTSSGLLVLVAVFHTGVTNFGNINTVSGSSISSVVRVAGSTFTANNNKKTEVWSAISTGSAGTITVAMPDTNTLCFAHVVEFSGVDTSANSNGIIQSASASGSSTSGQVPLSAFADSADATFLALANGAAFTVTPKAAWTELAETSHSTPDGLLETQFINSNDTTPTGTTSSTANWGGVAVELSSGVLVTQKANPVNVYSQAVHRASRF